MLPFELTKDTPYLALSGELWSVFYEYFNRNWPCYKGFLLYIASEGVANVADIWKALLIALWIEYQAWLNSLLGLFCYPLFVSQGTTSQLKMGDHLFHLRGPLIFKCNDLTRRRGYQDSGTSNGHQAIYLVLWWVSFCFRRRRFVVICYGTAVRMQDSRGPQRPLTWPIENMRYIMYR